MSKKRTDIATEYKWSIDEMFTEASFNQMYDEVKNELGKVEQYNGRLKVEDNSINDILKLRNNLDEKVSELFIYSRMKLDEDNRDGQSQERLQKINALSVDMSTAFSFIEPELIALDAQALENKVATDSDLSDFDHYIENLLRQKKHYLKKEQEEVIAQLLDVQEAPSQIFNMLENADMTFDDIDMPDGTKAPLNAGNFLNYLIHKDRKVRKQAFDNVYARFFAFKNTIAATYTSSVKKDVAIAKIRGFNSSIEMSLHEDNIDLSVYDNLVSATTDRLDLYHRYLKIRKELLAVDELHPYDLYVPLVSEVDMKIPFDDGFKMVKEALKPLGEDYQRLLDKVLGERWIDVYTNEGKSSGAYSWGSYHSKPFILLNYHDNINDVTTLAHELGHSMHSYMSIASQPFQKHGYSLFVAEVASTVNESIMMRYLIDKSDNKQEKMYLLNSFMEIIRGTIYRQTMFAEFERSVHHAFEENTPLGVDALCEKYYALNKKYFGDQVVIDDILKYEWARIPHFYRSFYVYSYATGLSAALNISKRIINKEEGALEGYLKFLSAGSSVYPLDALKLAGIDMKNPETFYEAFDFFETILNDFEAMMKA